MTHRFRFVLILAVAAFFLIAVYRHLFDVNSQYYFTWEWQWISSARVYPLLLPLAIPFFAAQVIYLRRPNSVWIAITLCMVSLLALMIAGAVIQKDPPSFTRISDVVRSRWTSGYFREALWLRHENIGARQLLVQYPSLVDHFYLHPRTKPPGPVLIEMTIIGLFGTGSGAAMISGFLIGSVAIFSIPGTFCLIRLLTGNRDAAFFGASYFALCPAPVLFFPDFDPCYPILTVAIIGLWIMAMRTNQARFSIALGFAYAITAFITYLPGVLVFFLAGFAVYQIATNPQCTYGRVAKHFAISFGTFVGCNFVFWLITGFNFIDTLTACMHQIDVLWKILYSMFPGGRHTLPGTIPTDLYDFALGSGWISFVLVGCCLVSARKNKRPDDFWIALLCVIQILAVAIFGLLQCETARVWIFMLPLLMTPIGLELVNWRPWQRMAVYAALLLLTAAMCQSMTFIISAV